MKILSGPHRQRSEAGVALLIAIFVLLLISVTAIALILSSTTETALAGNYRSSASTYYAALAGLEEARGRLLPSNPDYLGPVLAALGTPLPLGSVLYIKNPLPGETVDPTNLGSPSTYPDTEYQKEFPATPITNLQFANSVSPAAGLPGPLYKWVRINAVTEQSLNLDVDGDNVFPNDSTTLLYFDPAHLDTTTGLPKPSLIVSAAPPASAAQALEITALASLPNGSQKLLQYLVAPSTPNLNFGGAGASNPSFPAALALDGNNVGFVGPSSTAFNINGTDQFKVGACAPGKNVVSAIGYTNGSDSSYSNILSGIIAANQSHYSGVGTASPNVNNVSGLPQTPGDLENLVQTIRQGADVVIAGPVMQTDSPSPNNVFPPAMISSNSSPNPNPIPMTVVVDGDLNIYNWHYTGFGLLVVTGTLTYDPDASWKGIILVVGQGQFIASKNGSGQIDGAVLVAKTRDAAGNLLPSLGAASFKQTGGGLGIYYSTCWMNAAEKALTYKVLSYRQLSQ